MGKASNKKSVLEQMCDAILRAGKPLTTKEIADMSGLNLQHVRSETTRQIRATNMHVSVIEKTGTRKRHFVSAGPAPAGFVPEMVELIVKPKYRPKARSQNRFSSVWDYAAGRCV